MAGLDATILIKSELRPCLVNGQKALFHKWIVDGQNNETVGLIEFEDGVVCKCYPYELIFCDNEMQQYAFCKEPEDLECL